MAAEPGWRLSRVLFGPIKGESKGAKGISAVSDPTGGWAEAVSKAGGAIAEVIKAAGRFGSFIAPMFEPLIGMAADQFQFWKLKRQVRLYERWKDFCRERGLEHPTRLIPPKILLPLVEAASLEEDDELQDVYARMLANAGDAGSSSDLRPAFVSVLAGMTYLDVSILARLAEIAGNDWTVGGDYARGHIVTDALQDHVTGSGGQPPSRQQIEVSLGNLMRLGCVLPVTMLRATPLPADYPDALTFEYVTMTEFGLAFVRACSE